MQPLRHAQRIARFMLVWFVLSIGVAIASPMVKPQGMQLVCSGAGVVKVLVAGDDGRATTTTSHTLDCPLCASISAPPPMDYEAMPATAARVAAPAVSDAPAVFFVLSAPPPARAPPALL